MCVILYFCEVDSSHIILYSYACLVLVFYFIFCIITYGNFLFVFLFLFFFFNDPATTEIYTYLHTLSLHDALPIYRRNHAARRDELYVADLFHCVQPGLGGATGEYEVQRLSWLHGQGQSLERVAVHPQHHRQADHHQCSGRQRDPRICGERQPCTAADLRHPGGLRLLTDRYPDPPQYSSRRYGPCGIDRRRVPTCRRKRRVLYDAHPGRRDRHTQLLGVEPGARAPRTTPVRTRRARLATGAGRAGKWGAQISFAKGRRARRSGGPLLWLWRVCGGVLRRSEEHTSELQSLMRNSYAVFCLTKKKTYN